MSRITWIPLSLMAVLAACGGGSEPATTTPAGPADGADKQPVSDAPIKTTEFEVSGGTIDMITVKNGDAEVPAKFTGITGRMSVDLADPKGTGGELTIDLRSWDSGLELRDERIEGTFFEVEQYGSTTFAITSMETTDSLSEVGAKATGKLKGTLKWREQSVDLAAMVAMERTGEGELHVTTTEPFVVDIQALGMDGPKQALIELCAHESLSDEVKVSVDLTLGPPSDAPAAGETTDAAEVDADEPAQEPDGRTGPKALPKLEKKVAPVAPVPLDRKAPTTPAGGKAVPLKKSGD